MDYPTDTDPLFEDTESQTLVKILARLNELDATAISGDFPESTDPSFRDTSIQTLKKILARLNAMPG